MTEPCANFCKRAAVIGGSIAGLFAALELRKSGWSVDVYERSRSALAGRGAGIVIQPELIAIIRNLGLGIESGFGVQVRERELVGRDDTIQHVMAFEQLVTSWDAIHARLMSALPAANYHAGFSLKDVESTDGAQIVRFDNGEARECDLVIGADGFRSGLRQIVSPGTSLEYAGYAAWRGLALESDLPGHVRENFFERFCFHYPGQGQLLSYPVAGGNNALSRGERRLNLLWYRPVEPGAPLRKLLTSDSGVVHAITIPPAEIAAAAINDVRACVRNFPEPFRSGFKAAPGLFLQPVYDGVSDRLVHGRIALIGDAAFTARPHVGAGVTKAAMDAAALADCLAETPHDIDAGLARFETQRLRAGAAIIAETRRLGAFVNAGPAGQPLDMQLANMHDTATLAFLDRTNTR